METGFSLYFGTGKEKNMEILEKAIESKMKYAFTSLHIPEETSLDYQKDVNYYLKKCREAGIKLIADISPLTLKKLNCKNYSDLAKLGFEWIRLDFGFSAAEIAALSTVFKLVFNASTVTDHEIYVWKKAGVTLSSLIACHNFYPKPLTGLSLEKMADINRRLKSHGLETMAFVPGDLVFRGPLFNGLPTVEGHRAKPTLLGILELVYDAKTDIVLVGDIDLESKTWEQIKNLNEGFIALNSVIDQDYKERIGNIIHHDRPDSSDYVIRSQESRLRTAGFDQKVPIAASSLSRPKGSIFISNQAYLRYEGELEIARIDLPKEDKVNVIGHVADDFLCYLPYIVDGFGFKLLTD